MPSSGKSGPSYEQFAKETQGARARGGEPLLSDAQLRKEFTSNVSQGMTTGDALAYMTKMNLFSTGVKAVAGLFEESDKDKTKRQHQFMMMRLLNLGRIWTILMVARLETEC